MSDKLSHALLQKVIPVSHQFQVPKVGLLTILGRRIEDESSPEIFRWIRNSLGKTCLDALRESVVDDREMSLSWRQLQQLHDKFRSSAEGPPRDMNLELVYEILRRFAEDPNEDSVELSFVNEGMSVIEVSSLRRQTIAPVAIDSEKLPSSDGHGQLEVATAIQFYSKRETVDQDDRRLDGAEFVQANPLSLLILNLSEELPGQIRILHGLEMSRTTPGLAWVYDKARELCYSLPLPEARTPNQWLRLFERSKAVFGTPSGLSKATRRDQIGAGWIGAFATLPPSSRGGGQLKKPRSESVISQKEAYLLSATAYGFSSKFVAWLKDSGLARKNRATLPLDSSFVHSGNRRLKPTALSLEQSNRSFERCGVLRLERRSS